MITNIFNDIWTQITNFFNNFYDFVMKNYDEPFFWIILFCLLLLIAYTAINTLANK